MHSFTQAIYWLQAVTLQGERTFTAGGRNVGGMLTCPARMEEQFFLNACEKAVRWVEALSSEGRDETVRQFLPIAEIRKFRKAMETVGIRNLREHEEQHLKTGGKSLENELADASTDADGPTILVEPGITVLRNGEILIGGSVNVRETMEVAQALNTALVPAQHAYVRSEKPMLKDAKPEDYPDLFSPTELA